MLLWCCVLAVVDVCLLFVVGVCCFVGVLFVVAVCCWLVVVGVVCCWLFLLFDGGVAWRSLQFAECCCLLCVDCCVFACGVLMCVCC